MRKEEKESLYEMIVAGPEANGFNRAIWNTALIGELIERKFKVSYKPNYLSSVLKKMGLSYQKAGFVSDKEEDENYKQKRQQWCEKT